MDEYRFPPGGNKRLSSVVVVLALSMTSVFWGSSRILAWAATDPCADVEVVFARGTGEPPGVGTVGQAFIDSLRTKLGEKSLRVYGVNYPATIDFQTALNGIEDASQHVESMANSCPSTKMVLGGFSQGAAVIGFTTAAGIPDGAPPDAPPPMPTEVAHHVAAVTLFGTPSHRFMTVIGAPPITIGPIYAGKTTELCESGDPICSDGGDWGAHNAYANDGMADAAAAFAAIHLSHSDAASLVPVSSGRY